MCDTTLRDGRYVGPTPPRDACLWGDSEWLKLSITMHRTDGGGVDAELIRPRSWVESTRIEAGKLLPLNIEELQVKGSALVTAIDDCPGIAGGEGSVVTARFCTRQVDSIARVEILGADGQVEVLEGTTIHPIWSLDRNDWVKLGELEQGEQLLGQAGPATILCVTILNHPTAVYNIEVHGEHVYQVGELGVLVHNNCLDEIVKLGDDAFVNFGSQARTVVSPPGGRSYWFRWGDIKHLTPNQVRTVIGDLASAGRETGSRFIRVASETAKMVKRPPSNGAGIFEYISDIAIKIGTNIRLP